MKSHMDANVSRMYRTALIDKLPQITIRTSARCGVGGQELPRRDEGSLMQTGELSFWALDLTEAQISTICPHGEPVIAIPIKWGC